MVSGSVTRSNQSVLSKLIEAGRPIPAAQTAAPAAARVADCPPLRVVAAFHVLVIQHVLVTLLQHAGYHFAGVGGVHAVVAGGGGEKRFGVLHASFGILIGRSKPVSCETRRRHKLHPVLLGRFGLWPPKYWVSGYEKKSNFVGNPAASTQHSHPRALTS